MKKFVCVLLAMTMVFAFAACGKQERPSQQQCQKSFHRLF